MTIVEEQGYRLPSPIVELLQSIPRDVVWESFDEQILVGCIDIEVEVDTIGMRHRAGAYRLAQNPPSREK